MKRLTVQPEPVRRSIAFFRDIAWDDVIRINTHSMAEEFLGHGWSCGWLSGMMTPRRMLRAEFRRYLKTWPVGYHHRDGMFEHSPMSLVLYNGAPLLRSRLTWRAVPYLGIPPVRTVLGRAGLDSLDVCWIASLSVGGFAKYLRSSKVVYQAHDACTLYPGAPPALRDIELEMIRSATITVTTAESIRVLLADRCPDCSDRIHTLSHGVHLEPYSVAYAEPADLQVIPRPRAVLVGTLDLESDELLGRAAQRFRDVSFVCIGPGGRNLLDTAHGLGLTNVYLLGPRPQAQLPAYLTNCDLGLIAYPFSLLGTRRFGTNPMKRYEYAAAGLPTVSVNLREYALTPSPLYVADSTEEFLEGIAKALQDGTSQRVQLRQFASANSWREKYLQLLRLLGM